MVQTTNTSDNSGMGVILGILLAVLIVVGGYFFLRSEGSIPGDGTSTTANIEAPDVTINEAPDAEPSAGSAAPAPTAD